MQKRLFYDIKPQKYTMSIRPNLDTFTFSGEQTITFDLVHATNAITFHSVELAIQQASIVENGNKFDTNITYDENAETVTFHLSQKIPAGKKEISLQFTGVINDSMRGFYRSQYEVDGKIKYLAVTQLEDSEARRVFPSIDEPAAKAIFDITLIVPKELTAISNTISDKETKKGNVKEIHFIPTPKMSTYLVAIAVGELEYIEKKTKEGVLIRGFATPGKKEHLTFALDVAVKALSFFQTYFAIDYPLPVLDLIALPDFDAGAMENWGAVTFRESILLIDPEKSSLVNKQWTALVIAHELAHMWFGNLVTMQWWTYIWLNEGFACYIEYFATNALFPQWHLWDQFILNEHNDALALDSLENTHPVEVEVKDVHELKEIFDQISYAKGASVIYMLASYLGEKDFRDGLRYYLKKHAYGNTVTEDLWDAFEKVSKKPIKKIMQNWITKPGHPIITTTDVGKVFQKRFFSSNIALKKASDTTIWSIPLPVLSFGQSEPVIYLMKSQTLKIPELEKAEGITLNAGEASFVRVLYTQKQYEILEKVITEKRLPSVDRMGIFRDALAGAKAGMLPTDSVLKLARSYQQEDDYIVWGAVTSGIHAISDLTAHNSAIHTKFSTYTLDIFSTIAKKVGWEKKPNERNTQTLLRSIILYAYGKYGDVKTIKKAQGLFEMNQKGRQIDPDIRGIVYALIAQHGGEKEFTILKNMYIKEPLQQEKNRIGNAITSFTNPEIIQKILQWLLSEDIRPQDTPRFFLALFDNVYAQKLTWEFVKENWNYISEKYAGLHGFTRVIEGAGNIFSPEIAKDIKKFFQQHPTPEINRTVKQIIEQITANTEWYKRDFDNVKKFLAENKK